MSFSSGNRRNARTATPLIHQPTRPRQTPQRRIQRLKEVHRALLSSAVAPGGAAGPGTPLRDKLRRTKEAVREARSDIVRRRRERESLEVEAAALDSRIAAIRVAERELQAICLNRLEALERVYQDMIAEERTRALRNGAPLAAPRPNAPSARTAPAVTAARQLTWTVLPPGELTRRIAELASETQGMNNATRNRAARLAFLNSLGPPQWFQGSQLGRAVYYVAAFPRVVIADSDDYGNALYYCDPSRVNWRTVLCLEKSEARRFGALRLIHTGDWESRVRNLVRTGVARA